MELYDAKPANSDTGKDEDRRRKHDEWQKWLQFETFDDDADLANLENECRTLLESWKTFQEQFPGLGTSDLLFNELPTIETLKKVVRGAVKEWEENKEKGLGKAKTFLAKYCDTLLGHSQMFSFIPQGDKYTSVFTGVISSLIKRERLKTSFDQSYIPKKIQSEIKDIKEIVDSIRDEAFLEHQKDFKKRIEKLSSSLGATNPGNLETYRVASEKNLLPQSEMAELAPAHEVGETLPALEDTTPRDAGPVLRYEDLDSASRHLEPFDNRDHQLLCVQAHHPDSRQIPSQVLSRLRQWLSSTGSAPLWVMGRLLSTKSSMQSIIASHVVFRAGEADVPCVWFICRPLIITSLDSMVEQKQQLLTSLLYSLIRQLCRLVPDTLREEFEGYKLFTQLDGSPGAIPVALSLFRSLLQVSPDLLICVIDGLQLLDDSGELVRYVDELLAALTAPAHHHVVKLLVTTSGAFTSGATLGVTARLDYSLTPTRMRGRGVLGGQSMHSLRF
ncbi:hypothetical protein PG995_007486 [Apiospora arundinis]